MKILILEARFYDDISNALLTGAKDYLNHKALAYEVFTLPGALELPIALAMLWDETRYDAAIALGCVIRGETGHYDIVATQSARALMDYATTNKIPLGNGILTVEDEAQAWERADPAKANKGASAAQAAVSLMAIKKTVSEA